MACAITTQWGNHVYWTPPNRDDISHYLLHRRTDEVDPVNTADVVAHVPFTVGSASSPHFFDPFTAVNTAPAFTYWVQSVAWDGQVSLLSGKITAIASPTALQTSFITNGTAILSNITVCNALTVCGASTLTGIVSIGNTLHVCGASTFGSTVNVSGAVSISSTLWVCGATTLNGLTVSGSATIGTLNVTANFSVSGTLYASGAGTFGTTLTVCTSLTVNGTAIHNVASDITTTDAGGYFASTNVEENLQEIGFYWGDTNEPNGFPNRSDSVMSFNTTTLTFSISPAVSVFNYYVDGVRYTANAAQTQVIPASSGLSIFYFTSAGLTYTSSVSDDDFEIIVEEKAICAVLYYTTADGTYIYLGEERHGIQMDGKTHHYLHDVFGCQYETGFALNTITADASGALDEHAQFGVDAGKVYDEDIAMSASTVAAATGLPIFWRSGTNGYWRTVTKAGFSVYTTAAASRITYNAVTSGEWSLIEVTNNQFALVHIFATTKTTNQIIAIMGQNQYSTLAAARAGGATEINNLLLGSLPGPELRALATVIFQTSNTYVNAVKARIRSTDTGGTYYDWRTTGLQRGSGGGDHGSLSGLSDDDHLQYLLLAGRTSTQTICGAVTFNGVSSDLTIGNNNIKIGTACSTITIEGKAVSISSTGDITVTACGNMTVNTNILLTGYMTVGRYIGFTSTTTVIVTAPPDGIRLFGKDSGGLTKLVYVDSAGTEYQLPGAAGGNVVYIEAENSAAVNNGAADMFLVFDTASFTIAVNGQCATITTIGGAGNVVYIEEGASAVTDNAASGLYINFTNDQFDVVTASGTSASIALSNPLRVGGLNVTAALSVQTTIHVSGSATFGSTVNVSGAVSISSTLFVCGTTTLNNATISGTATIQTLNVTANASVQGTFHASGASTFGSTLSVSGQATFSNNVIISGTLTVTGNTSLSGTLNVSSVANFGSSVSVGNTLYVCGLSTLCGGITVNGVSNFGAAVSINSTLNVSGAVTFSNNLLVSGTLTVCGTTTLYSLVVTGNATVTNLSVTGNATVVGTLNVCGIATFSNHIVGSGKLTISGAVSLGSTLEVASWVSIVGAVSISSTLHVSSNVTISGTITVGGISYFNNNVAITGTATIDGTATINNNLNVSGNLTVCGSATVNNLSVTGSATVVGTLKACGVVTFSNNLIVSGTGTIAGAVTICSTLTVTGAVSLSSTLVVGSTFQAKSYNAFGNTSSLTSTRIGSFTHVFTDVAEHYGVSVSPFLQPSTNDANMQAGIYGANNPTNSNFSGAILNGLYYRGAGFYFTNGGHTACVCCGINVAGIEHYAGSSQFSYAYGIKTKGIHSITNASSKGIATYGLKVETNDVLITGNYTAQYGIAIDTLTGGDANYQIVLSGSTTASCGIWLNDVGGVHIGGLSTGTNAVTYISNMTVGSAANDFVMWDTVSHTLHYCAGASARIYKTNIRDFEDNWDGILSLQPKIFNKVKNGLEGIGYIAEDVEELGLEKLLIRFPDGKLKGLKYDKFTLYAIEVIKEQEKRITKLENEIIQMADRFNQVVEKLMGDK